jgi:hypothetical protein
MVVANRGSAEIGYHHSERSEESRFFFTLNVAKGR